MKICFIAPLAYPTLCGTNATYVTGPAVFQVLLAKELIKYDFDISFLTYDNGNPSIENINGIKVIKIKQQYLLAKIFVIWKALKIADSDIYYNSGGIAGIVSLFCRFNKKHFVLGMVTDAHVNKYSKEFGLIDRLTTNLDIYLAHNIITQSKSQQISLKEHFNKESVVFNSFMPLSNAVVTNKEKTTILWVGSMADVKQPELFLKLAHEIPQGNFKMIGGYAPSSDRQYTIYKHIKQASQEINNFEFLGYIPFSEITKYYEEAVMLVNTSKLEGFPNAFLQAWMNRAPVVSLNSDPDEIICKYKLGFHSKTFGQMIDDVNKLLIDEHTRNEMGLNGKLFVEKEHNTEKIMKQYIDMFNNIMIENNNK